MLDGCDGSDEQTGGSAGAVGAAVMVLALLVQFILGIRVNLYVPTSSITGGGGAGGMMGSSSGGMMDAMSRSFSGSTVLMLHMMLGWLLLLAAIASVVGALISRDRRAVAHFVVGLLAIGLAAFGGLKFVATGHDVWSFVMAVGFAIAVATYAAEIYALR